MRLTLILIGAIALGACSRSDADKLKHDTQAVGHDVASDIRKAGDNPDLKAAGQQLGAAAHAAGQDLSQAGHDLGRHARRAGQDARGAVNQDNRSDNN